jgi:hypothetical protein
VPFLPSRKFPRAPLGDTVGRLYWQELLHAPQAGADGFGIAYVGGQQRSRHSRAQAQVGTGVGVVIIITIIISIIIIVRIIIIEPIASTYPSIAARAAMRSRCART